MATKFSEIYDDSHIPFATKEEKAKLVATGAPFIITAVSERASEYKGKRQEQWVVTIQLANGAERLLSFTKSANRDKHIETIAQSVPVEGVALTKVGKDENVWAFIPAGAVKSNTRTVQRTARGKK